MNNQLATFGFLLLLCCLICPQIGIAQNNNSCAEAQTLNIGDTVSQSIQRSGGHDPYDYFKFSTDSENGTLSIEIATTKNRDVRVKVWKDGCTDSPIVEETGSELSLSVEASAATDYYIEIYAVGNGKFNYSLTLNAQEPSSITLLAEYRMDSRTWDSTSGEVIDWSGNGYHATAVNGPTKEVISPAIPGNPGTCYYGVFDGVDDYLALPDSFPDLTSDYTITAWIRTRNNTRSGQRILIDDPNNTQGFGFSLGDGGTGRVRFFSRSTNPIYLDTPRVVENDTWYFVAAVADISNNTKSIYVYAQGGAQLTATSDTYTGSWGIDAGDASMGGENDASNEPGSNFHFEGNIDEVKVHTGALTATQIKALQRITRQCSTPVAEYRFDLCSETDTILDDSGNGFHGTVLNGPLVIQEGRICNGAYFDGVDDYVQVDDTDVFDNTSRLTIAGWIKPESIREPPTGTNARGIISKRNNASSNVAYGIFFYSSQNDGKLYVDLDTTNDRFSSNAVIPEDVWTHFAVVFDGTLTENVRAKLYLNGNLDKEASESSTTIPDYDSDLYIGNLYHGPSELKVYKGMLDELRVIPEALTPAEVVTLYHDTRSGCLNCTNDLHYLEITHDGSAIACIPEQITIRACANAACSSLYLDGVSGTLNVGGNSTSFSIPPEASETTVSIYVPADGTSNDDPPQLVTLAVGTLSPLPESGFSCSNTSTSTENCQIGVYKAGFDFDVPHLKAGTAYSSITINAIQTSDEDPTVCTPLFESGERSVCFWGQYEDPTTGTGEALQFNENNIDTVVAGTAPECTSQTLTFTDGSATLPEIRYDDVGKMQLHARYEGSEEHDDEGLIVIGSDSFVVKPHHFSIDSIKCSDDTENLEATISEGEKFCRAGEDFHVQVSARNAFNALTRNFGRETAPESVRIERELELPSGGISPELNAVAVTPLSACDGNSADATFCVTTAWPEVGIIKLIPGVGDENYLEAGDVNETAAEHVGRFIPHHFDLTPGTLTNRVESSCDPTSTFTYLDENLEFTYKLTAKNAAGVTTKNYHGDFAKFDGLGAVAFGLEPNDGYSIAAIDTESDSFLNDRLVLQSSSMEMPWDEGEAEFKVKLHVKRSDPEDGPFDNTIFGVSVIDSDNVSITDLDLDADDDGTNEHKQSAPETILRYGRIRLENAHGSELLDLPMLLQAEYWNGNAFILNDLDNCTLLTETDLSLTSASGSTASINNQPLSAGDGDLVFSAPGKGGDGWIDVELDVPDFLQYDWKGNGDENPTARATFGIFKGNERIIYLRETTWRR